jgi:excisionase family DNA binding protein
MSGLEDEDLLTPLDAARVLGISPETVRALSNAGRLPTLRTVSGRRLFRRSEVERLAAEREHVAPRKALPWKHQS